MPDTNERLIPEQRAESLYQHVIDLWCDRKSDTLIPQAIATAIREAEAAAVAPYREALERIAQTDSTATPGGFSARGHIAAVRLAEEALGTPVTKGDSR